MGNQKYSPIDYKIENDKNKYSYSKNKIIFLLLILMNLLLLASIFSINSNYKELRQEFDTLNNNYEELKNVNDLNFKELEKLKNNLVDINRRLVEID